MANLYAGGTSALVSEIAEILDADLMQILWRGGAIASVTEIPQISLYGLNIFVKADIASSTMLAGVSYRLRRRGGVSAAVSGIQEISKVGVLPERFVSAGQLTYNGKPLNGQTIPKGAYMPMVFEVSGDRLTADMDVILTVEKINKELIFQKKIKIGVFDDNTESLPDGRDSISGTIVILPTDTIEIPGAFIEAKYNFRLANPNIRNYFLENGTFILKDV